jgi:hypothetical protein
MYDFTDKYICLILISDSADTNKNQHIYSQIHNAGFEIVFLYTNNTISNAHIIQNENGYYKLTIPTEEGYVSSTVKMCLAYSFFATQNIKGILKVGENVYHIEDVCLDLSYFKSDYLGALSENLNMFFSHNSLNINDYYNNLVVDPLQLYFEGSFYWVSKKSIEYILSSDIDKKIFNSEDIYVGVSLMNKHDIKLYNSKWNKMGNVLWAPYFTIHPELNPTELCAIMGNNNSDKGNKDKSLFNHNYTTYYYELFKNIRYDSLRIFELGLGTNNINVPSNMGVNGRPGASLYGWAEFFPNSFIYGADIDTDILFQNERIKTYYCDQTNPDVIRNMWEQPELQQKFDIIIDDGLHLVHSNKCFFENSIHKLNSGGIYIIEDVHDEFLYIFNNIIDEWKSIYTSYTFKIIKLETSHKLVNNNIIFIRT